VTVPPASLAPESEHDLVSLIRDLYAPRINAALAVSQGKDHLQLYAAPDVRNTGHKNHGHPHFLANYLSDTEQTSAGLPRGRLVGIVKSFDRWNTGMRNEAPQTRRVPQWTRPPPAVHARALLPLRLHNHRDRARLRASWLRYR
jgi:hypothetical protein